MRIYYLDAEYEPGKHKILKAWSEFVERSMPEDSPQTQINLPYSVLELDERFNRWLARQLLTNSRPSLPDGTPQPDKYYVDNSAQLRDDTDTVVNIVPNPEKEEFKTHVLYQATPQQARDWVQNNINNLTQAKNLMAEMAAALVYLARQSRLEG